jgi:hypothetical protein
MFAIGPMELLVVAGIVLGMGLVAGILVAAAIKILRK